MGAATIGPEFAYADGWRCIAPAAPPDLLTRRNASLDRAALRSRILCALNAEAHLRAALAVLDGRDGE